MLRRRSAAGNHHALGITGWENEKKQTLRCTRTRTWTNEGGGEPVALPVR